MAERPDFSHAGEEMAEWKIPGEARVTIGYIGEGYGGDFDAQNHEDVPLLRFDAYDLTKRKRDFQDASYCTAIPAWVPAEVLKSVCRAIAEEISDAPYWKRILEGWSWVDEKKAREIHAKYKETP